MTQPSSKKLSRRAFTAGVSATAAFTIVPRQVLGGSGYIAPSDRINLGVIGLGRQGLFIMMNLLQLPEIQVTSVCDVNQRSKDYAEYSDNATLTAARKLLGAGYENWGDDWASPGRVQLTKSFSTSLGIGGREPARQLVDAYYTSRRQATGGPEKSAEYSGCAAYSDFREMLAKESNLDAVYIATPDHWHALISIAAMRKGKHVLCQKPMAHSIGEARRMASVAREMKVATALPVNNPYTSGNRLIREWILDGAIGKVKEVHNWTTRPYWPQGIERPREAMPVPSGFNWDMWLGPAQFRPYNKAYLPFVWRGWYDFGCGSFGDMGCYSFAGIFRNLDLTPPVAVEATTGESYEESFPQSSIVHLDFPAKGTRGELRLSWYDGGLHPPRPSGLSEQDQQLFKHRQEGVLYLGDKGFILAGFNGNNPRVYPANPKYESVMPAVMPPAANTGLPAPVVRDAAIDAWIGSIKRGTPALTAFDIQAPVTEAFLLGCITQRLPGEKLNWDAAQMKVTNNEKANALVDPAYRSEYAG